MNDTTQRTPETGTTMIELWDSFGPLKGRLERWSLDTATSLLRRGMMSPSTLAMGWFVVWV
ncbi:MAG: hypothetical protein KC468_25900, partial [Myxococcales bacterium]|nr:hypothetical protein [Myxococcales bacterium]